MQIISINLCWYEQQQLVVSTLTIFHLMQANSNHLSFMSCKHKTKKVIFLLAFNQLKFKNPGQCVKMKLSCVVVQHSR